MILGPGESGKSTLVKQFRLLNKSLFSDKERLYYKGVIIMNVLDSMRDVMSAVISEGVILSEEMEKKSKNLSVATTLSVEVAQELFQFVNNENVKKVIEKRSKFMLSDVISYYFSEALRIAEPTYQPTDQDILRTRTVTTGIVETRLEIDGHPFKIVDVGGQRSERRKWIHCFQDVSAVIYCASLAAYDIPLREDDTVFAMDDAINLFGDMVNNKFFRKVPFFLFLNKYDVFTQKITSTPITVCPNLADYQGDPGDVTASINHVRQKFLDKIKNKKEIPVHVTCATDPASVGPLFNTLKEILIHHQDNQQL